MRVLILILMLGCFVQLHATTYYFSNSSGNDARSATEAQNASTPWKSLNKINAIFSSLNDGDILLLKRDEVFDGSLVISRSGSLSLPITFGAYGSGAKPVINGLTTLTDWVNTGGGIWESDFSSGSMVNMVLMNGLFKEIGRYPNMNIPNKGYLNFESYSGNSSITDNELPASPNWNGGEVVIRKTRWVVDRNQITSHTGNTINYISESEYGAEANFGYFIQNHPKTLDVEGEWYYKKNEGKFGMYFPSGNPASFKIQASSVQTLVSINNQSNIAFENLSFQGPNIAAFDMVNARHIRISGCDLLFSGVNAANGKDCNDVTIENGEINQTNNVAINFDNCANTTIRNNKINNSGVIPGMGKGNSGSYEGILISGDNILIDHNSIENTGYIAVTFRGSSNVISNNFINNFAMVKDDAAGIYSWNNIAGAGITYGLKITNNLILNGIGAPEGTIWPGYRPASGIYMDDNISNVEITGNTAANCGLNGIYIHNSYNINLQNNLFYNNASQVVLTSDEHARQSPVRNVNMANNVMVAREYYQRVAEFKSYQNDLSQFGNFDNNYYARPVDDNQVIYPSYFINGNYNEKSLTLDEWKALYGKDLNSNKSPASVPGADHILFEYNSTSAPKTVALNGNYIDIKNQSYNGSITLEPYSSVILLSPQNVVSPPSTDCQGTGGVSREQWNGIPGNDISAIPLNNSPSSTSQMTSLESLNLGITSYGARVRGYVCPPQTGNYIFMVSGDDQVELWLSTDTNPDNKKKIASTIIWTSLREFAKYPSQQSNPVALQAGQLYYIEVLHKNGDGGNHFTVAWNIPNVGIQVPIPGNRLVPYTGTIPTTPPVTTNGLNYKYYEGNWDALPNFSALTPVKTGTTANIDISVRNVNDYFGIVWEGYINIPIAGTYTFETVSDDGSKFYFNSGYLPNGNALVNNDGLHPAQSATGSVNIAAAGAYPVAISFFEKYGGESMQLYWTGPGIPRQLVPNAAFIKGAGSTDGCSASGSILHEIWQNVGGSDIASIPLNTTAGTVNQITSLETLNLGDNYGERIRGYLCPPLSGNYTFMISGDDNVELWLSSDDNPANKTSIALMNDWTDYHQFDKYASQKSTPISLQSGHRYYIEVLHKESYGGDHVTVAWQLPNGTTEVPIAGSYLSPYSSGLSLNRSGNISLQNEQAGETFEGANLQLKVNPNPFRTTSTIQLHPVESGSATVELYTVQGVLVKRMFSGKVQSGVTKTFNLSANGLLPGVYIIHLVTKTKVVSQKIILMR